MDAVTARAVLAATSTAGVTLRTPSFQAASPLRSRTTPSVRRSGRTSVAVRAAVAAPPQKNACVLPTWAEFELGVASVYWETANGLPPASGELFTVWFNPESTGVSPNDDFGIAFNGGFNSPIMCGGEPRQMTKKSRGPKCVAFYSIKVKAPAYAKTLEFSFTDGSNWHGPMVLELEVPLKWRNQPMSWFNERLREEMAADSACEDAIFPDSVYLQDRCIMPGGLGVEEGQSCELPIVAGCMDKDSPNYDPLATHDDGSCPIDLPQK